MRAEAAVFERVWASHLSEVEPVGFGDPELPRAMKQVAVAEALRSLGEPLSTPAEERLWSRISGALEAQPTRLARTQPLRPRRHWPVGRAAAAAVALFAALGAASLRAGPGSILYPLRTSLERTALVLSPSDGGLHAHIAEARLGDLVDALEHGPEDLAPGLARDLVEERSAAVEAGADVSSLDMRIATTVPPALTDAPMAVANDVRDILGGLLPTEIVDPLPSQGPGALATGPPRAGPGSDDLSDGPTGGSGPSTGSGGSEEASGSDDQDSGHGSSTGTGSGDDGQGSNGSQEDPDSGGSGDSGNTVDPDGSDNSGGSDGSGTGEGSGSSSDGSSDGISGDDSPTSSAGTGSTSASDD